MDAVSVRVVISHRLFQVLACLRVLVGVLRQPLLVKLEQLLEEVNERGREAHTFTLLSAYRTPSYNAAIGNETTYSRHSYGDAADIFVDANEDGRMDDLNRDGRHNLADAHWLGEIVDAHVVIARICAIEVVEGVELDAVAVEHRDLAVEHDHVGALAAGGVTLVALRLGAGARFAAAARAGP